MEIPDCTTALVQRIRTLEPENATKVCGYVFLSHTSEEIMGYSVSDDETLQSLIDDAKAILLSSPEPRPMAPPHYRLNPPGHQFVPVSTPTLSRPFSSNSSFRVAAVPPYWDGHAPRGQAAEFLEADEHFGLESMGNFVFPEALAAAALRLGGGLGPRSLPAKACHYFIKGYCKHGTNCRFIHDHQLAPPDLYPLGPGSVGDDAFVDVGIPGSLEELDREIAELLRDKKGFLVSTATLPQLYYEKYGKLIQADGYLTESQRHGKIGHNLTKLLSRLQSIRLIDKPHGQHAVVLVEDAPKFTDHRSDVRSISSASQIYLTFPADSDFTTNDVMSYFSTFGPVHEVRIPHQDRRMFGFVSFFNPETARCVLSTTHPHVIKNSRVLVKPYKEKTRQADRRISQKTEHPPIYHHPPPYFYVDNKTNLVPILYSEPRLNRRQLMEEQQQAMELEAQRLHQLQLATTNGPLMPHHMPLQMAGELENSEGCQDNLPYPGKELKLTLADDKEGYRRNPVDLLPDSPFAAN